jgi:hypothetical protein
MLGDTFLGIDLMSNKCCSGSANAMDGPCHGFAREIFPFDGIFALMNFPFCTPACYYL